MNRSLSDRLLGLIGGAMLLLAVVTLLRGGEGDDGATRVPALAVLSPRSGDTVSGVLTVVFRPGAPLKLTPAGWGTGDRHIHLTVAGRDFMPARGDVAPLPEGRYRWTFARLPPGPHRLRLFWSDAAHRPLVDGRSAEIGIVVR